MPVGDALNSELDGLNKIDDRLNDMLKDSDDWEAEQEQDRYESEERAGFPQNHTMSTPINNGTGQAMLVTLSFGLPRQSRQLPKEADKVETDNNAQHGVAKVSVWYFQQRSGKITNDALAELKSHFGFWKREHDRLTLPWMGSSRLLASAIIPQYIQMRSKFEESTPAIAEEFYNAHHDWLITAPDRMGALFDPDDFPSLAECRERIAWQTSMMPLPESAQWKRIALISPAMASAEEARFNEAASKAREAGHLETWQGLIGHFQKITETLQKDKPRIFETLITGLTDMLDLMPAYSELFNDQDLTRCAADARATLGTLDADSLRSDPAIRTGAVRNAKELIARFGTYSRKFA